jgi:hypothetical protein
VSVTAPPGPPRRPDAVGREQLREQIFAIGRALDQPHHRALTALASEIGTP